MTTNHTTQGAIDERTIEDILNLQKVDDVTFRGPIVDYAWKRVFGGQVLGQALRAASLTVDPERSGHSLHSYFLLAGDPTHAIDYEVEQTRDGGSFSTRRVKAIQQGNIIFVMSASFHKPETGLEHQDTMPDVPGPHELRTSAELAEDYADALPDLMRAYWQKPRPIEFKPADPLRYIGKGQRVAKQLVWMRAADKLPNDLSLHQAVLAYASDYTLLDTALVKHGKLIFNTEMQLASIDHAIWFHRDFRADDWLLYAQDSPTAQSARGLSRGTIFTQDGELVASTAQEGLMRVREQA